jgi:hypothetical protein
MATPAQTPNSRRNRKPHVPFREADYKLKIIDVLLFYCSVSINETSGCWNWLGDVYGHGRFWYGRFYIKGYFHAAHRFSYVLHKGKIPKGLQIDHKCENKLCVNPEHLDAVTGGENQSRKNPEYRIEVGAIAIQPKTSKRK